MDFSKELAKFIRWVMRDVTYLGTYPGTIDKQVGETCDIRCDSPKIGGGKGLSNVPLRHGIPGVEIQIAPGARALLAFHNGDPDKPYVALWEKATVITLKFVGGTMPIARVGDQVAVSGVTPGSGVAIGTIMAGQPKALA
jgi:hypothetical protein